MLLNENVEWFVLEDWTSRELGRYKTLDQTEAKQRWIIDNDIDYKNATTDEEKEDIENGIYEDLYVYGLDKDNNELGIQFG